MQCLRCSDRKANRACHRDSSMSGCSAMKGRDYSLGDTVLNKLGSAGRAAPLSFPAAWCVAVRRHKSPWHRLQSNRRHWQLARTDARTKSATGRWGLVFRHRHPWLARSVSFYAHHNHCRHFNDTASTNIIPHLATRHLSQCPYFRAELPAIAIR
jgi:hypothetical protein